MARKKHAKPHNRNSSHQSQSQNQRQVQQQRHPNSDNSRSYEDFTPVSITLRDVARSVEYYDRRGTASRNQLRHQFMSFVPSSEPTQDYEKDYHTILPRYDTENQAVEAGEANSTLGNEMLLKVTKSLDPEEGADIRSLSASPDHDSKSATSDDEVVFSGRRQPRVSKRPADLDTASRDRRKAKASMSIAEDYLAHQSDDSHVSMEKSSSPASKHSRIKNPAPMRKGIKTQEQIAPTLRRRTAQAALDDYLENIKQNNEVEDVTQKRKSQGDDDGWATSDLQDFDLLSTSSETPAVVSQIISRRERSSGLQYLIVGRDQPVDEARWVLRTSLSPSALALATDYDKMEITVHEHSIRPKRDQYDVAGTDSSSDWETGNDLNVGDESESSFSANEENLAEQRQSGMTDEHIARLLQKQEHLGIFSEDLQLFDGDEDLDPEWLSSLSQQSLGKPWTRRKRNLNRPLRRSRTSDVPIDSMFDLGDYGDFDPTDRERASILSPRNAKSNPFALNISDSDIANDLNKAWEMDRKKKKAKKQQREELRLQGLLGKNKSKPDLKSKYTDGMSLSLLEQELELFLLGDNEQLALVPMDKTNRKIVHDIANKFGLHSKSQGSGRKRFPVLHKTRRTIPFDEALFGKLRNQLDRRFLVRMDVSGRSKSYGSTRRSGAGNRPEITYREGEIVGASAPEIGAGNRGRAMLEKMGWSAGTALGTFENQGILMPIEHIMKNSKAGLG